MIADAVTPTARVRLTGWMLSPGTARQEFVCKYFQKGSLIAIDGRLQSRSYQDKNGNNRTAIEIVANNVNFAAPKSANAPHRWVMPVTAHPRQPRSPSRCTGRPCAELFCRQQ